MASFTVLEPRTASDVLKQAIRAAVTGRQHVAILEAGCGRRPNRVLARGLEGIPHRLAGVDSDEDALRLRRENENDLDEELVGDLRTIALPAESFDVVFSAWVAEHIAGAEQVLDRFVDWLKPGGVMVLRIPDGDAVFGWVTRNTPYRVHVLYTRWIRRQPNAGKPGFAPYPTVYDRVVSRRGMRDYCASRGLEVLRDDAMDMRRGRLGVFEAPIRAFMRAVGGLSMGRLSGVHMSLQYVIRKPVEGVGS